MKSGVLVSARMGSSRLPGKAMLPLMGSPMLAFLLRRLRASRRASMIALATTVLPADDVLADLALSESVGVFRGSASDVMGRFVMAARHFSLQYVVRVTADCPFLDGPTLDYCLEACEEAGPFDLATTKPAFPRGIDYEIYPAELLDSIYENQSIEPDHREHVTKYIYDYEWRNGYRIVRLRPPPALEAVGRTFTVDTRDDYDACCAMLRGATSQHVPVAELP